jgi:class 3 adenylate cyclase
LIVDSRWNLVYVTDQLRETFGGGGNLAMFALGEHFFGRESMRVSLEWLFGSNSAELMRLMFRGLGPYVLTDTHGGKDELRQLVDLDLRDIVDELSPHDPPASSFVTAGTGLMGIVDIPLLATRIRGGDGRLAGTAIITKPAAGMAAIGAMVSTFDLAHFERMQLVAIPGRRPAAILMADLEGSSQLSRRMSTASYFSLGRRLVRAADNCVVEAGGIVGRHVGDGVVAFFLAESSGSESAATRACISASRELRSMVDAVASRSELQPEDVILRFGLHWGSTLYVGNITTRGRTEVTALGDEVNEAARIEACATGGRTLASKSLIERLSPEDAERLEIEPDRMHYELLAELSTATEKARRDAPSIAVCEL